MGKKKNRARQKAGSFSTGAPGSPQEPTAAFDGPQQPRPAVIDLEESATSEVVHVHSTSAEQSAGSISASSVPLEGSIRIEGDIVTVTGANGTEVAISKPSSLLLLWHIYTVKFRAATTANQLLVVSRRPDSEIRSDLRSRLKTAGQKLSKRFGVWSARIGALALWLTWASYFVSDTGVLGHLLIKVGVSATWEPHLLVVLLALVLVGIAGRGSFRSLLTGLYLAFAPLVLLAVLTSKLLGGMSLLARLGRALGSWSVAGANWLIAIACCAAVVKTHDPVLLWISVAYLGAASIYVIVSDFHWASSPLGSMFKVLEWVDAKAEVQIADFSTRLSGAFAGLERASGEGNEKVVKQSDKTLMELFSKAGGWYWFAELLRNKLRGLTSNAILFYLFAVRFLLSLAFILVAFGVFYLAIAKLDPDAFKDRAIVTLPDAIWFSVGAFFTAAFGDIVPVSALAKGVVVLQIGTALVIISLLALSYSMLSHQTAAEATAFVEKRAGEFINRMFTSVAKHYHVDPASLKAVLEELKANPRLRLRRPMASPSRR